MRNFKNLVYILTCMSFTIIIGAATYEHLAVWPLAYDSPPASLGMFQGEFGLAPVRFWARIHPVTLGLFVLALVLHWKSPRRKNLLVPLIGYALVLAVTAYYFVPELTSIVTAELAEAVDPDLVARGDRWQLLSWVRQAFLMVLAGYLYLGLTRSHGSATAANSRD